MACDCTNTTNYSLACKNSCNGSLDELGYDEDVTLGPLYYRGPLYLALIRSVFLLIIMFLAVCGNILVILSVYRNYALRNVAAVFMVNLAIADISVGIVCMPYAAITSLFGEWVFGEAMCIFNGAMNTFFCVTSMLTLSTIALDRYFAIVQALHYHSKMNKTTVTILITWAWVQPLVVCLLPVIGWSYYTFIPYEFVCTAAWHAQKSYTLFASLTCFGIPLAIMAFSYFSIFKVARDQGKKIAEMDVTRRQDGKKNKPASTNIRTILIPSTIIGAYAFLWLPHMVGMVCLTFGNCTWPDGFFAASTWMGYVNSACNPVIYAILDRRFRTTMLSIGCGCLKKKTEDDFHTNSTTVTTLSRTR